MDNYNYNPNDILNCKPKQLKEYTDLFQDTQIQFQQTTLFDSINVPVVKIEAVHYSMVCTVFINEKGDRFWISVSNTHFYFFFFFRCV